MIEADGFDIAARVYMVLEGENLPAMAKTTGLGLLELATVFDNLRPDVVVTVADRYETIATAVAAAYMNIPLAHVQGGEVTGSIDEKVRHAVTKLADLHLVATEQAAERVVRMGEDPSTVFVTGCPSIDLAAEVLCSPALDFDPFTDYGGVGQPFDLSNGYLVVMQHPVTTEYECGPRADRSRPSTPRTRLGAARALVLAQRRRRLRRHLERHPELPRDRAAGERSTSSRTWRRPDFLRLLYNCRCLVGNSSVGIRECSFLGVPVVNIGTRQTGRDRGANVFDVSPTARPF